MPELDRRPGLRALAPSLCAAGLGLGLCATLAAFPALSIGAWEDSEPVGVVTAIAVAVTSSGLFAAISGGSRRASAAFRSPLVLLLLGIAAWGLLTVLWARFPMAALLGAPQSMQGPLWYMAAAVFLAGALFLKPHRGLWRWMINGGLIASVIMAAGNLPLMPTLVRFGLAAHWPLPGPFFGFNQHLAYPGLALLAMILTKRSLRRPVAVGQLVAVAFILVVSSNGTSWLAAALMIALRLWRGRVTAPAAIVLVLGVHLLPLAALSLPPAKAYPSLVSRLTMRHVLEEDWRDQPWRLVIGSGWGQVQDTLARFQWRPAVAAEMQPWIDRRRDEFHSHSAALEALYAGGLPTLALWLAWLGVVAGADGGRTRRPALTFAVGWALLEALWFPLASHAAWMAFAAAAATRPGPAGGRKAGLIALPVITLAFAAFAAMTVGEGLQWRRLLACLRAPTCVEMPEVPADPRGIQSGLAATLTEDRRYVLTAAADRLAGASPVPSPLLDAALAASHMNKAKKDGSVSAEDMAGWTAVEDRLLAQAPWRWDVLNRRADWLVQRQEFDVLGRFAERWAARSPGDAVPLWYAGLARLDSPQPEVARQGLVMMRQALAADPWNRINPPETLRRLLDSRP